MLLVPLVALVALVALAVGRVPVERPPTVRDLSVCEDPPPPLLTSRTHRDLEEITAQDVLRVALPADPTSFYLADKRFAGFEHDVIRAFALHHRLRLELHAVQRVEDRLEGVREGRFDIAAGRLSLPADPELHAVELFRVPRVLVQAQGSSVKGPVQTLRDLEGRALLGIERSGGLEAVQAKIPIQPDPLPDGMVLEEVVHYLGAGDVMITREDLISRMPAHHLEIGPTVGAVGVDLAVSSHAHMLHRALRDWMGEHRDRVDELRAHYLDGRTRWRPRRAISPYDPLFRAQEARFGRPWTVLAAVAWQESRFNPTAESRSGARGVMQLMPFTADELEVTDRDDPRQSIAGGARYLKKQDVFWSPIIHDESERLNFVLASYNAGRGHVEDARALAVLNGFDGDRWEQVAPWIRRLKSARWFRHPVVKFGHCRGDEPVEYVRAIRQRLALYDTMLAATR